MNWIWGFLGWTFLGFLILEFELLFFKRLNNGKTKEFFALFGEAFKMGPKEITVTFLEISCAAITWPIYSLLIFLQNFF